MTRKNTDLVFLLAILILTAEAFLDNLRFGSCPAQVPCTCNLGTIDCTNIPLTRVPAITNPPAGQGDWLLKLQGNQIQSVPDRAFEKLKPSELRIDLSNNFLFSINALAFMGVENATTWLNLANNRLQTIPQALTTLPNLRHLEIQYNPIVSFQDHNPLVLFHQSVFQSLGQSLEELHIGSPDMHAWPSSVVRLLKNLVTLKIYGISKDYLPSDAFHGFESTLDRLDIYNTSLRRIPVAVCTLPNLRYFVFEGNSQSSGHSLFPPSPCVPPLRIDGVLYLDSNGLTSFPSPFQTFPNVVTLSVSYNPGLHIIEEEKIPENNEVTSLYLIDDGFRRVPTAIKKFTTLFHLHLEGNQIISIESADLNFTRLQYLNLEGNPLEYVSSNAFINTPELQEVHLGNTHLKTVPPALSQLHNLVLIDMEPDLIECTCTLAWLKPMLMRHVPIHLNGTCETSSERLSYYVTSGMTHCI